MSDSDVRGWIKVRTMVNIIMSSFLKKAIQSFAGNEWLFCIIYVVGAFFSNAICSVFPDEYVEWQNSDCKKDSLIFVSDRMQIWLVYLARKSVCGLKKLILFHLPKWYLYH